VRSFLEKDDSNKHVYKESAYDCKHFSLELYRRAQTNGMACRWFSFSLPKRKLATSSSASPRRTRGTSSSILTPLVVNGKQNRIERPSPCSLLAGRGFRSPLNQIPADFTNDIAFFDSYTQRNKYFAHGLK